MREFSETAQHVIAAVDDPFADGSISTIPSFLSETSWIRSGTWKVDTAASGKAMTEVIFPASSARLMEEALRSRASLAVADIEGLSVRSWGSVLEAYSNISNAAARLSDGASYIAAQSEAGEVMPALSVKVRGFRAFEKNVLIDGGLVHAPFLDIGVVALNSAPAMLASGQTPLLHIPHIGGRLEASLWNSILDYIERELNLARGCIKAEVLIDNVGAAFEMNEIAYELRSRIFAFGFERWNYLTSIVKRFGTARRYLLNERRPFGERETFIAACERLLVETAHRRGLLAIGGTFSGAPLAFSAGADTHMTGQLLREKRLEMAVGYDGSRVFDGTLIPAMKSVFCRCQYAATGSYCWSDEEAAAKALLSIPTPKITDEGIRSAINSLLRFYSGWLSGKGFVEVKHNIEDLSTAEYMTSLLWQWARAKAITTDGRVIHGEMMNMMIDQVLAEILRSVGGRDRIRKYEQAAAILKHLVNMYDVVPSLAAYLEDNRLIEECSA